MMESFLSNLNLATRLMSDSNRKTVERFRSDLVSFTYNFLKRIKNICGVHENTLAILNPENVLRRGYTITSLNGKIVKSIRQVAGDDVINTQFSDGKVTSKVIEKTKDKRLKKQE
jgi:exodeoxyribonuclease VII large subunit